MTRGTNLSVSAPSRTQPPLAITLAAIMVVSTAALGFTGAATHGNHGHLELDGLDGDGSAADPYVITNVTELQLTENDLDANYILGNDIDASDTAGWNDGFGFDPVGTDQAAFTGTFDGNNHVIEHLTIVRDAEVDVGLFGVTQGAIISDVELRDATVTGARNVGGLVGQMNSGSVVKRVETSGQVTGYSREVGGLIGYAGDGTTVVRSSSTSDIEGASGANSVGGLIGETGDGVVVSGSSATGDVKGTDGRSYGGLIGQLGDATVIVDSHATGDVSSDGEFVGGLVGEILGQGNSIVDSFAEGNVSGTDVVGGLIGDIHEEGVTVKYTSAHGQVTGTGSAVGGLVGETRDGVTIYESTATGDVTGVDNVGGLVGGLGGHLVRSEAEGRVNGSGSNIGGLVGHVWGDDVSIVGSSASGAVSGEAAVGGLIGGTSDQTHVVASVATGAIDGTENVGGLVGEVDRESTFVESAAVGDVHGEDNVGGFVGDVGAASSFIESDASGTVTGTNNAGGFAGRIDGLGGSSFIEASASGDVEGGANVGGFVGHVDSAAQSSFVESTASGGVSGDTFVGGFAGNVSGSSTITESTATGDVVGTEKVGGLVGSLDGTVARSYAIGAVEGETTVGGLVGMTDAETGAVVSQVYAAGVVDGNTAVGGLFGNFSGATGEAAYWDIEVTEQGDPVGLGVDTGMVGLTTAAMTGADADGILLGFDFEDSWTTTDDYPVIQEPPEVFELVLDRDALEYEPTGVTVGESPPSSGPTLDQMVGNGTLDDPYVISNATELQAMEEGLGSHYILRETIAADVTDAWNGGDGFEPVGSEIDPFTGSLVGDGHTIRNLTINRSDESGVGLFGVTEGSLVEGVVFEDSRVSGGDATGTLVGEATETVIRGTEAMNMTVSGTDDTGGLAGTASVTVVRESTVSGDVSGTTRVGGLIGTNVGSVDISRSSVEVAVGTSGLRAGGLVGLNDGGIVVTRSNATGSVEGIGKTGGLVGENRNASVVSLSYATGEVSSAVTSDSIHTGGLLGVNEAGSAVTRSYAAVDLMSESPQSGGVIGANIGGSSVTRSAASGDVSQVGGNAQTGGFGGANEGGSTITRSATTGNVTSDGRQTGGFLGENNKAQTTRSSSTGAVEHVGALRGTGGFVGSHGGLSYLVHTTGSVTSDGDEVGGFGGNVQREGLILGAHSTGDVSGVDRTGGFLGYFNEEAAIVDSYATSHVQGVVGVGGFVGETNDEGSFGNLSASGDVLGTANVGGFAGEIGDESSFVRASATGDVTGDTTVGGFVGEVDDPSSFLRMSANGNVTATGTDVGGFAGLVDDHVALREVSATGTVATSGDAVGGLIGSANGESAIVESLATGDVVGENEIGGLLGATGPDLVLVQAYARGAVDGASNVGGAVGVFGGTATELYAVGPVNASNSVGGLIGTNDGLVQASYWDVSKSGQADSDGGTPLTTDEMTGEDASDNMEGFDFAETWITTEAYPVLAWEATVDDPAVFEVTIERTNAPVVEGETLQVDAIVENTGGVEDTQPIRLEDIDGAETDSVTVTLGSAGIETVSLSWDTEKGDADTGPVTVRSDDDGDSVQVRIDEATDGDPSTEPSPDPKASVVLPEGDQVVRGDIIPIEIHFEHTDTGTVTFGDRDTNNVEIDVTVRDVDGSGDAQFFINTFQVGHGYLTDGDEMEPNFDVDATESRNHGFFTLDPGTALLGEDGKQAVAHPNMDIGGGSQGLDVLDSVTYNIVSVAGDSPRAEEEVDDTARIDIRERHGSDLLVHAAPGTGENAIDPKTSDEIDEIRNNGFLNPADGAIANDDFLVIEVQSDGLTGIIVEAITQDENVAIEDIYDREEDHIITEEFFTLRNATSDGEPLIEFDLRTIEQDAPDNVEAVELALDEERVIASVDESGNFEHFFVPIQLEPGQKIVSVPDDRALVPGMTFETEFVLAPPDGTQASTLELLREDESVAENWQFQTAYADVERNPETIPMWNPVDRVLEVPAVEDIKITGLSNTAAGTNLTIQVETRAGQEVVFLRPHAEFIQYNEGPANNWSITEDFSEYPVGTEFTLQFRRAGEPGNINPGGERVSGVIVEERELLTFEFNDQEVTRTNQIVTIAAFETNRGGFIVIYDEDGEQLGQSSTLSAGPHENVAIAIDPDLPAGDHELTAAAYVVAGESYNVETIATITVLDEDLTPAFFNVGDLTPSVTINEPSDDASISAQVTNTGEERGTQIVEVWLNGEVVDSEEVTLGGGHTHDVEVDLDTSDLDYEQSYEYTVSTDDDSQTGVLTVEPEPTDEEDDVVDDEEAVDDDDVPGFGVVVALLALIGTVLIARRRQD